jgi:hypothetical protein
MFKKFSSYQKTTKYLIPLRENIAVYSESYMEPISTLLLRAKADFIYRRVTIVE